MRKRAIRHRALRLPYGNAVPTGNTPLGEGPSPVEGRSTKGVGAQSTQRTRKLSTRDFSCMPAKWNQTRVKSCGCRRNGHRGFMGAPWRSTKGVEPDAVKVARPVLNGGDEETCGNVTRLVPTQPGHWARLTAGVRCFEKAKT